MRNDLPPGRIRAHLQGRDPVAGDVHSVADAAWDLLSTGLLDLPLPGSGETITRWTSLVEVASVDLAVARLIENHLEAQALFAEIGRSLPDGLWAVWSDEGAESNITVEPTLDGWRLEGTKAWCVGARSVTNALVTAVADDGVRVFVVPTRADRVRFSPGTGPAIGMALADPLQMTVEGLTLPPEAEVGERANWYHERNGYWATAAANAALWYGGALGIARAVRSVVEQGSDPFGLAHLGLADALCSAMRSIIGSGARAIDTGDSALARTAAWQTRATVELLAADLLRDAGQVLGGDVLAADEVLARRLADLTVELRRHGGEREYALLGADVLGATRLT